MHIKPCVFIIFQCLKAAHRPPIQRGIHVPKRKSAPKAFSARQTRHDSRSSAGSASRGRRSAPEAFSAREAGQSISVCFWVLIPNLFPRASAEPARDSRKMDTGRRSRTPGVKPALDWRIGVIPTDVLYILGIPRRIRIQHLAFSLLAASRAFPARKTHCYLVFTPFPARGVVCSVSGIFR